MVSPAALRAQWPLVGRDDALSTITASLRSPAADVVLVYGPPGGGKTRLAHTVATMLAADNWLTVAVAASEATAAMPLAALAPALAIARIQLGVVAQDPVALFEQARGSIGTAAAGRRVLLVVDDLAMLDGLSLVLVTQLVAAGTVKLIATLRDGVPVPDAILARWTGDFALRIDVPMLTAKECDALLGVVLDGPVSHRCADEFHRMSGGNPLFLRELVFGSLAAEQLARVDGTWDLVSSPTATPALVELIRARLKHLDRDALSLVERIAVCQPLALDDLTAPDARRRVIELEDDGIITVEQAGSKLLLALTHPQYEAAIRGSLSRLRTIDLLLEQADIAETQNATPENELRIATWRLEAGHPSSPDLLGRAAQLAALAQDHRGVVRLTTAALDAGAEPITMLSMLGEALWSLGRDEEAIPVLDRAASEDAAKPTTNAVTGTIARMRSAVAWGAGRGTERALDILDAAIRQTPSLAPVLALPRSVLLLELDQAEEALVELSALAPADGPVDPRLAMYTSIAHSSRGLADEAIASSQNSLDFATARDEAALPSHWARMIHATVLLESGRPADAQTEALTSLYRAVDFTDEAAVRFDELTLGNCALALGRLRAAARWFRDLESGAALRGPIVYREPAKAMLATALAWQGRLDEAMAARRELSDAFVESDSRGRLVARWLDAVTGDAGPAIADLVAHGRLVMGRGHATAAAELLHAAVRLGDAKEAASLLAELAAGSTSPLIAARAAQAVAEAAGDVAALVAAAEAWVRSGHRLFAAETFASASAHAARQGSGRDAYALGQRAEELAAKCDGAATPALQFLGPADPLTKREREIASLAAQGLTSIEIAERLFLSPRTIDNHLQAVYGKLGIRGRSELTAN